MIVEYIRYTVPDEAGRAALVAAYDTARVSLEASSHCLAYELTQCDEDPNNFVLRIEWDSADGHLKGFRSSQEFRTFYQAVAPFVPQIVEMRHYRRTHLAWRRV
jgi:quinol monooxygenase YgiN